MSGYLLSVDGGGTATEFCVADDRGKILFSVFSGPSSFKSVGKEAALSSIRDGLRRIAGKGILPAQVRMSVWGMSGCDTGEDHTAYEALLHQAGWEGEHRIVNDAVLAFWAGAEPPGTVIIAGTGSIAMGFDSGGNTARIGGWNYTFSDLGSGYWMGSQLLREYTLWLDGCREDDPVFVLLSGQESPETMRFRLSNLSDANRIAAYARIVLEEDSPLCEQIREQASGYLAGYASAMQKHVGEAPTVVLSGGLFRNDGFFELVASRINGKTVRQQRSPAVGGILLARQWMNKETTLWTCK